METEAAAIKRPAEETAAGDDVSWKSRESSGRARETREGKKRDCMIESDEKKKKTPPASPSLLRSPFLSSSLLIDPPSALCLRLCFFSFHADETISILSCSQSERERSRRRLSRSPALRAIETSSFFLLELVCRGFRL